MTVQVCNTRIAGMFRNSESVYQRSRQFALATRECDHRSIHRRSSIQSRSIIITKFKLVARPRYSPLKSGLISSPASEHDHSSRTHYCHAQQHMREALPGAAALASSHPFAAIERQSEKPDVLLTTRSSSSMSPSPSPSSSLRQATASTLRSTSSPTAVATPDPFPSPLTTAAAEFARAPLAARHNFLLSLLRVCKPSDLSLLHCYVCNASELRIDFITELPGRPDIVAMSVCPSLSSRVITHMSPDRCRVNRHTELTTNRGTRNQHSCTHRRPTLASPCSLCQSHMASAYA